MQGTEALNTSEMFAFSPSAQRARVVDARVRTGLADSLAAVFRALGTHFALPGDEELIARIRAQPVPPAIFGLYTELVEAIDADDLEVAHKLAAQLCAQSFDGRPDLRTVTLTDADLGPGEADRYRRLLDEDPNFGFVLPDLQPEMFQRASARVAEAIALIDATDPELSGEIRALVREIVLIGSPTDGTQGFNGASSFQLWGALFLNADAHANRVELAEALVHEGAHALLFGLSLGRSLVENETEALYPSPLRSDPRPMDGVVHATYVMARMHYLMTQLLKSSFLSQEERQLVQKRRTVHVSGYNQAQETISHHARWTPVGEAAFAGAKRYMAGAA